MPMYARSHSTLQHEGSRAPTLQHECSRAPEWEGADVLDRRSVELALNLERVR